MWGSRERCGGAGEGAPPAEPQREPRPRRPGAGDGSMGDATRSNAELLALGFHVENTAWAVNLGDKPEGLLPQAGNREGGLGRLRGNYRRRRWVFQMLRWDAARRGLHTAGAGVKRKPTSNLQRRPRTNPSAGPWERMELPARRWPLPGPGRERRGPVARPGSACERWGWSGPLADALG